MVLPVTSNIVKNTALRIEFIIKPMSPICSANILLKADSVEVLVSLKELANILSISLAIFSLSDLFLTLTM